jgi:thiamine transport system ATP-binding protein
MLAVEDLTVRFGQTTAVEAVSFSLGEGERLAVLGPSGCGKSTLLRAVAGLEAPASGTVTWDGHDLAGTPPHRRRFGLMFQGYALFPHMDVEGNVAFGLRMEGRPPQESVRRVGEVLAWVGMEEMGGRSVERLSGGEQQRVALARTMAPEPRLLMLDEPLGSLDRTLRERLVVEMTALLESAGTTTLYVTHDHDEAAVIADRVALMREGRIVQVGTMGEIRRSPADEWVAGFVS